MTVCQPYFSVKTHRNVAPVVTPIKMTRQLCSNWGLYPSRHRAAVINISSAVTTTIFNFPLANTAILHSVFCYAGMYDLYVAHLSYKLELEPDLSK